MGTSRKTTARAPSAPRRVRRTSSTPIDSAADTATTASNASAGVLEPTSTVAAAGDVQRDEAAAPIGHEAIALRAYELYAASGYQDGHELQHWLDAEAALRDARADRA